MSESGNKKRGTEVLRCGAQTPNVRLRGQGAEQRRHSCTREGGYLALRPTASQFIATPIIATLLLLLNGKEASA